MRAGENVKRGGSGGGEDKEDEGRSVTDTESVPYVEFELKDKSPDCVISLENSPKIPPKITNSNCLKVPSLARLSVDNLSASSSGCWSLSSADKRVETVRDASSRTENEYEEGGRDNLAYEEEVTYI